MNPDREQLQDELMEAVCSDDEDEAIRLIDEALARGADFTSDRIQPLYFAALIRHARTLKHLLHRGASMTAEWPNNKRSPDGPFGDTALHEAASHGDMEALHILLEADGRHFVNTFNIIAWTPLICTVIAGHEAAAALLIKHGADVNAREERLISNPAIRHAVQEENIEMVKFLLQRGADPTLPGFMMLSAIHEAQLGGARTAPMLEMFRQALALPDAQWKALLLPDRDS